MHVYIVHEYVTDFRRSDQDFFNRFLHFETPLKVGS